MPIADASVEEGLIPLSALQHYAFCPRQCALIHLEGVWADDGATAEGRLLHDRVDAGRPETRSEVRIARGLALRSLALGVVGKSDVVEFPRPRGAPYPVEYKRGGPKQHRADEVQLCAQGICLEEAFGVPVPAGALFYAKTKRRLEVEFDEALRDLTGRVASAVRADLFSGRTPLPIHSPACRRCSMREVCCPEQLERPPAIDAWLASQVGD